MKNTVVRLIAISAMFGMSVHNAYGQATDVSCESAGGQCSLSLTSSECGADSKPSDNSCPIFQHCCLPVIVCFGLGASSNSQFGGQTSSAFVGEASSDRAIAEKSALDACKQGMQAVGQPADCSLGWCSALSNSTGVGP